VLHLQSGLVRQYSICGDREDRREYVIAVRLEKEGRGGSRFMHESLRLGSVVNRWSVGNTFPFDETAQSYRFIAGGVGITPLMPMIARAHALHRPFVLDYCSRSPSETLFYAELAGLAVGSIRFYHSNHAGGTRWCAAREIVLSGGDEQLYCCGPAGLIADVKGATLDWPTNAVRFEYFQAEATMPDAGDREFTVEAARTGAVLRVPADKSMLWALREHGLNVESSCEAGACGTCQTRYLDGIPDHRDLYLTEEERREFVMVCVSRAHTTRLVLDI